MNFKKIMAIGAATLCSTVLADVTSANIVGYAQNDLDLSGGSVILTPQFVDVSSAEGLKLKDLKPVVTLVDQTYVLADNKIVIQFVDNGGYTLTDKVFRWNATQGKWINKESGLDSSEFVITNGLGVSVDNAVSKKKATIALQGAGQVGQSDVLIDLDTAGGSVLSGNPFPAKIKLGSVTPSIKTLVDPTYTLADNKIVIQFVDNGGYTLTDQVYRWNATEGKWINKETGLDASDVDLEPGVGFSIDNAVSKKKAIMQLRFPAPAFN